jgi:hypothetical protein
LRGAGAPARFVVLTTGLPHGDGEAAIRSAGASVLFDVIDMGVDDAVERLRRYAKGGAPGPLPGFWKARDLPQ